MAFYPAHCDNVCYECEKNKSGWCIWKDRSVSDGSAIPESSSNIRVTTFNTKTCYDKSKKIFNY